MSDDIRVEQDRAALRQQLVEAERGRDIARWRLSAIGISVGLTESESQVFSTDAPEPIIAAIKAERDAAIGAAVDARDEHWLMSVVELLNGTLNPQVVRPQIRDALRAHDEQLFAAAIELAAQRVVDFPFGLVDAATRKKLEGIVGAIRALTLADVQRKMEGR